MSNKKYAGKRHSRTIYKASCKAFDDMVSFLTEFQRPAKECWQRLCSTHNQMPSVLNYLQASFWGGSDTFCGFQILQEEFNGLPRQLSLQNIVLTASQLLETPRVVLLQQHDYTVNIKLKRSHRCSLPKQLGPFFFTAGQLNNRWDISASPGTFWLKKSY